MSARSCPQINHRGHTMESSRISLRRVAPFLFLFVISACKSSTPAALGSADTRVAQDSREQILLGRRLVLTRDCGGRHGGFNNPANKGWLAGLMAPTEPFHVGAFTIGNTTPKPFYITPAR